MSFVGSSWFVNVPPGGGHGAMNAPDRRVWKTGVCDKFVTFHP